MRHVDTSRTRGFFEIVGGTGRSQAATMILEPGRSTGGPDNRHEDSDQWLYVVSGRGTATVEGETTDVAAGSLVLVEAGEAHEIEATGDARLVTVSVYAPPAYRGREPSRD